MTPTQYTGGLFFVIVIPVFAWQGVKLVVNPREWLERHGRSTAAQHVRASRFIGWMFLAGVLLSILQLIRSL
jgi:hypothetical protein